jgi:hypothetical protein
MPFKEQNRRDSWPPTIVHLQDDDSTPIDDIDENPFVYFLTSPSPEDAEDEPDYFEDLTAGIEAENEIRTLVREVSPSAIQRIPLEAEDDSCSSTKDHRSFAMPLSLRDFTLAHESKKHDKKMQKQQVGDRNCPTQALRGRRLTSSRTSRGRGKARSLSAPRAHSWREPSPEVYSIPEEREDTELDVTPQLSSNTHADKAEPVLKETTIIVNAMKRVKKRVRWALP